MELFFFILSAFTLLFLLYFRVLNTSRYIYIICFYLPLSGAVNFFDVSFVSFIIISYLVYYQRYTIPFSLLLVSTLFMSIVLLNSVKNNNLYEFLVFLNFTFSVFFVYFCLRRDRDFFYSYSKNINIQYVSFCMFLGILLSFILGFIIENHATRQSGFGMSPNILAAFVLINLSFYMSEFKFKNFIFISILFIIGLLTASRLFLFGLFFILMYTMLFKKISDKYNIFLKILMLLIFTLVIFLLYNFGIFDVILDRVLNPRNDDITNSRSFLWLAYLEHYFSDAYIILFGGEIHFQVAQLNGIHQAAHNFIIEPLIFVGITGTLLAFFMLYYCLLRPQYTYFLSLPVLTLFLTGFTTHSFISVDYVMVLFISLVVYRSSSGYRV